MSEEMTTVINNDAGSAERKKNFRARIITSVVYVLAWILLCTLKWVVPGGYGALGFDAVFCVISIVGSMEFLNAMGGVSFPQRAFTIAFAVIIVPLYVVVQMTMQAGFLAVACAFCVYVMFLAATSVFDHGRSTVKGTINCIFCMLYCGVLSTVLASINHLSQNSMVAVLVLFMSTALCDTGAYTLGSLLKKKIPLKLAPKLSPNKTVIGAIGGLLGGVAGGLMAYGIMLLCGGVNGNILFFGYNGVTLTFTSTAIDPAVTFTLVGLATAVLAQVGDLFESAIKRECGVKDMGKCLPGHGGILDRFDSMLYCSVVVLLSFGTIII